MVHSSANIPFFKKAGYGLEFIFLILEHPVVVLALDLLFSAFVSYFMGYGFILYILQVIFYPLFAALSLVAYIIIGSWLADSNTDADWTPFIEDKSGVLNAYKGKKIPIQTVQEAYQNGLIDFKKDFLETWINRNSLFRFVITKDHLSFFIFTLIKDALRHNQAHDHKDVGDVYNRGNDFYNWFLGPTMIYTSGIFQNVNDTLEEAQTKKLDLVCTYTQMKPGMKHLDIGCGWGTLVCHAAKNYGTDSTGVTLAKEQVVWGEKQAREKGVTDRVHYICKDYRDIPESEKFDVITCLEMAEHVGIKNFQNFLLQVKSMLKDDGIFYLQIAGLRRTWQYEDLVWGLFMDRYVFPGADASCPLGFVVSHLERAGYEVHRVENTGVHYSLTIRRWYENWQKNKDKIIEKYGQQWFRKWNVFLGWSVLIAGQGSSTLFMITNHKNHKNDAQTVPKSETTYFDRTTRFVGDKPIATQQ